MVFKSALENNGYVKGINVKNHASDYSRKKIDQLTELAKTYKAKGLAWLKVNNGVGEGPIAKFFSEEQMQRLIEAMNGEDNAYYYLFRIQNIWLFVMLSSFT